MAAGTGCDNPALIKQQLAAAHGDVDAAIEAVIEILAAEDASDPLGGEPAAAGVGSRQDSSNGAASAPAAYIEQQEQQAGGVRAGQVQRSSDCVGNDRPGAEAAGRAGAGAGAAAVEEDEAEAEPAGRDAASMVHDQSSSSCMGQAGIAPAAEAAEAVATRADARHSTSSSSSSHQAPFTGSSSSSSSSAKQAAKPHSKGVKLKGGSGRLRCAGHAHACAEESDKRPSRNKPCPCGSGRKHKNCCGLNSSACSSSSKPAPADGLPVQLATLHI